MKIYTIAIDISSLFLYSLIGITQIYFRTMHLRKCIEMCNNSTVNYIEKFEKCVMIC